MKGRHKMKNTIKLVAYSRDNDKRLPDALGRIGHELLHCAGCKINAIIEFKKDYKTEFIIEQDESLQTAKDIDNLIKFVAPQSSNNHNGIILKLEK